MNPPGYHHRGFVASHALGHMIYGFGKVTISVLILGKRFDIFFLNSIIPLPTILSTLVHSQICNIFRLIEEHIVYSMNFDSII